MFKITITSKYLYFETVKFIGEYCHIESRDVADAFCYWLDYMNAEEDIDHLYYCGEYYTAEELGEVYPDIFGCLEDDEYLSELEIEERFSLRFPNSFIMWDDSMDKYYIWASENDNFEVC